MDPEIHPQHLHHKVIPVEVLQDILLDFLEEVEEEPRVVVLMDQVSRLVGQDLQYQSLEHQLLMLVVEVREFHGLNLRHGFNGV